VSVDDVRDVLNLSAVDIPDVKISKMIKRAEVTLELELDTEIDYNNCTDADFRILSVEYFVDAGTQTLELGLELGREQPFLADYLYALRSKVDSLSRHKIGRLF